MASTSSFRPTFNMPFFIKEKILFGFYVQTLYKNIRNVTFIANSIAKNKTYSLKIPTLKKWTNDSTECPFYAKKYLFLLLSILAIKIVTLSQKNI